MIVCTEQSTVAQRVRGLKLGADDSIAKPCHPLEVIARVESIVRRRRIAQQAQRPATRSSRAKSRSARPLPGLRGEQSIDLTRREFELIELLASAEGRVLEREEIYSRLGATRWCAATAQSTCSCASCARSSRRPRPAGGTSTRTSASATASRRNWRLDDDSVPVDCSGRRQRRPRAASSQDARALLAPPSSRDRRDPALLQVGARASQFRDERRELRLVTDEQQPPSVAERRACAITPARRAPRAERRESSASRTVQRRERDPRGLRRTHLGARQHRAKSTPSSARAMPGARACSPRAR